MAETAIISARKARLQQRAEAGDEKAMVALSLAVDPADFLSATQIGITLVGVLAGAFGGATIAGELAVFIGRIEPLRPYSQGIAIALVVLAITYLSLIVGELVPKRLALNDPERAASRIAVPMQALTRLTYPLARFLSFSSDLVLRTLGVRPSGEPPVTEEEIQVLLEQGTEAGVFEEAELDMVQSVFRLADRRVGSLMTPRPEIAWLDLEDPAEEIRRRIIASPHSRMPVAEGSLDNVMGIVQAKDLLARSLMGQQLDLRAALVPPMFVPESMLALNALEQFRESGVHIALVIDEFGGVQGLVTLYDILEAIVGDIPAEGEAEEPEVVQREDGSWLLDGGLPVDEFKDIFGITRLPDEERGYYNTLGGFIMTRLGRIPAASDFFEWAGLRFEVVDMDGFRVDKVLVLPVQAAAEGLESG
jgi:putative hemolysin